MTLVTVASPIADAVPGEDPLHFNLGRKFGYTSMAGVVHYWDGQDIWLNPNDDDDVLYAVFGGTLRFFPSGRELPLNSSEDEYGDGVSATLPCYPAIGDTLLLDLWPEVIVDLGKLLPEGAPIPRTVVYQNIDRPSAILEAKRLVRETPGHEEMFRTTAEGDLTNLDTAINAWVENDWVNGRGVGIHTSAGTVIGRAATVAAVHPSDFPSFPVEYPAPTGANPITWRRLTFKVFASDGFFYNPAFLFYLIEYVNNSDWVTRPQATTSALVERFLSQVNQLPVVRVSLNLGEASEDDMSSAPKNVRLEYMKEGAARGVTVLFDHNPHLDNLWRSQSDLFAGNYQLNCFGPQFLAGCNGSTTPESRSIGVQADPPVPTDNVNLEPETWMKFDENGNWRPSTGSPRFVLGVNMEAFRRRIFHDLADNEILGLPAALDYPTTGAQVENLRKDLANIAALGVRVIRVWVFERFEGLRFHFTTPGLSSAGRSLLQEEKHQVDTSPSLTNHAGDLRRITVGEEHLYVCTYDEWKLPGGLSSRLAPPDPQDWVVPAAASPTFQQLIRNALLLQSVAVENGLSVLWTLWTHFAEAGAFPRAGERRTRIESWIYRDSMTVYRESLIRNAFQEFMNRTSDNPGVFGYEIMNEADIVWNEVGHSWAQNLRVPSEWHLSLDEIRTFIADSIYVVPAGKPVFTSVLGTVPDCTMNETRVIAPGGTPNIHLSASGLTRYATAGHWTARYRPPRSSAERSKLKRSTCEDIQLDGRSPAERKGTHNVPSFLFLQEHHNSCLFLEAGSGFSGSYDCDEHYRTIQAALHNAYSAGYAGIFIWHYNDPSRRDNTYRKDNNSLTENSRITQNHFNNHLNRYPGLRDLDNVFQGAKPRPACLAIKEFADQHEGELIPRP